MLIICMESKIIQPTKSGVIISILALIVFIYRLIYLGYPMFLEGIKTKNYDMVFKSLTTLV